MVENLELLIDGSQPVMHCSCCGFKGGKKELGVREWTCLNCGAFHDRDINAAIKILNTPIVATFETKILETPVQLSLFSEVAGGQSETLNKTRSSLQ
ncbi:zinc ribbon domain-containing protein [Okeania sp. SIO3I5]|uniref:zinc ribbon domain-containing protein n=1 Tax=Okeania sp. SIO3I5 TaxID=2607805 RepID=UPI0025FADFBB|nr:zinc ribbon domain-containing protein [Okeania sp. SIO3I5]